MTEVFSNFQNQFRDKKVLIFGLGVQGRGLGDARIFAEIGSEVRITDLKTPDQLEPSLDQLKQFNVSYTLGEHKPEDILWADVIIRNASVPWKHPLLELAREHHIAIEMDEALFFQYAQTKKTIGVTGTRGKSTTTTLIYQLLLANNYEAVLAGNISPVASLELLKSHNPNIWYVFELSSWQLQAFAPHKISPHLAVLTNIYPDHLLDRSFAEYIEDKTAIFQNQTNNDYLILNKDNYSSSQFKLPTQPQIRWFSKQDAAELTTELKGDHNKENIAAALQVANILGLSSIKAPIESFPGLPYRLQRVGTIKGAGVINDTTSTTPTATMKALEVYPESILILGGTSKKLPTELLIQSVNQYARKVILLPGSGTDEIKASINPELLVGEFATLRDALAAAVEQVTRETDVILFSPGFTSFGLFINEFDRGEKFNHLVAAYG